MALDVGKAELLSELQTDIGKALWQIQAFEDTLAHLIALVLKLPAKVSLEEAEAMLDDVRKGTLGKLVRETRRVVHFKGGFELFMNKFISERNWLVHRSWRESRGVLTRESEYRYLRSRVQRIASDALEYNQLFARIIEDWAKEQGVDDLQLQQLQKEFLDDWGS